MIACLQITLGGLFIGAWYGLAAIGLQFILGTTKKVHLTYGHLCLLAALAMSSLPGLLGWSPVFLIPALALSFFCLGWLAHPRALFSKLNRGGSQRSFLLVSLGFALVFEDIGSRIWALPSGLLITRATPWHLGSLTIPVIKSGTFAAGLAGALTLTLFIRKSLWGKAFRAWETAGSEIALVGVDQAGLGKKAMAIGFGFAGLAGALLALSYPVSIQEGLDTTLKALCLAVIAGTLAPLRVLGVGLLLGVGEGWIGMLAGSQWSPVLSYAIFLTILTWRNKSGRQ